MALMFARLARNFVKNGYFPTDAETLGRIQNFLAPSEKPMRILDPCCGEGTALADIRFGLQERAEKDVFIEALGIEFDHERAWHSKSILDRVIHADLHDVVVKARSMGLLFLNPPYGFGLKDDTNANVAEGAFDKAERLERTFLKKTVPYLMPGGVLIYIVPYYALDDEIRSYLARNFKDVRVFMSPEQQFKQCVIFGVKTRSGPVRKDVQDLLASAQRQELMGQVLPEVWDDAPYLVPAVAEGIEFDFHAVRLDGEQLSEELGKWRSSLLWGNFETRFNQCKTDHKRPLREMTKWHMALALAAGQITGQIQGKDGRVFLIKGNTFKKKERIQSIEVDDKGNVSETITMLDRFVPVINAIEFTPDHRLGQIVKIS